MRNTKKPEDDDFDASEMFSDEDFDLETFIDSMEAANGHRRKRRPRPGWRRIDDLREAQWLRDQLQDWDDWSENDA